MPKISQETRAKRRNHILASARRCFAMNGFQATSMDNIISATGMSSSAVYRYFRSKEEIINATTEDGLTRVRDDFAKMAAERPVPSPEAALASVVARMRELAEDPETDPTRVAILTWAEALRSTALHDRARVLYHDALAHLTELASQWLQDGHLGPGANPRDTAVTFFTLMQGMLVYQHVIDDLSGKQLLSGLAALGGSITELAPGHPVSAARITALP